MLGIEARRSQNINIAELNFANITNEICQLVAIKVEATAKGFAPYDTGALHASIKSGQIGLAHWRVSTAIHYGIYNEFGTYKMRAWPFMRPAAMVVGRELAAIGIKVIKSSM